MEKYIKDLITNLSNLETGAKFMGVIISLLCFIADILLRSQNIHVPNLLRGIYFCIGIFSILWLSNDFFKSLRLTKEAKDADAKFIDSIKRFSNYEHLVLYKFACAASKNIKLDDDNMIKAANNLKDIYGFIDVIDNMAFINDDKLRLLEIAFGFKK